jgi:type VI secretion system protein ImpL
MSDWHKSQISWALGLGFLTSFYGIVGLIVYYVPTELFGGSNAYKYKIITIALVLLTLPFALIIGFIVSRRAKKKEEAKQKEGGDKKGNAGTGTSDAAPQKLETPKGNYNDISQSAEEAVQFLRSSNLGNGKDAVYELPWYLVIGNPKSGKSSLSLASNLSFQTLPSQRQSEQKFVRPTQKIDWRVTNDAVFLDTAGRYQTEGAEQDEWSGILETLRKYRGNRPLDGMILTISAERILHSDEKDIEEIAKVLRARIDETIQRLKVRFPIYLVFTHADSIEGFRDSFSNSQKEGENLVWGATIPLEKSENAHSLFDEEFGLLQNSIMKRRLMRLSAPFPPVRQLKIFNFPLHFGSARKKLGHFVTTLFRPNPFSENPFLRGYYFTAVPVNRPKMDGGQTMTNVGQTIGQTYFTQKLFRDVILRDKDLVSTFQSQKVGPPLAGWLLTFLGAFLTFILLALAGFSLYKNRQLVQTASKSGEDVLTMIRGDKDRNPLAKPPEETTDEIDKIDELRKSLEKLDDYDRNGAPILMRFGLYSGTRLYREKLLPIYYNAIEQRYKKPVLKRLENDLRKFAASNPVVNATALTPQEEDNLGKHYDLLKAYLMFTGQYQDQGEATFVFDTLRDYWKTEAKIPEDRFEVAEEQLRFYAKQVDRIPATANDPSQFPRLSLEDSNTKSLVEDVRKKLQAFPARARYLKRVLTDISKKVEPISADSILAGRSQGVIEGSHTVPGAYTIDGYFKYFKEALNKATEELSKDDWVMGERAEKAKAGGDDLKWIESKYLNDYADNWRKFIQRVTIAPYKDKDTAVGSLKAFSNAESPMKIIMIEVARQTNLAAEPAPQGFFDWIFSFFQKKKDDEKKPETIVEKEFKPLFAFTDSKSEKTEQSPISLYGADLKKVADELETKSGDEIKSLTLELSDPKTKSEFAKLLNNTEKAVNNKVEGFKVTATGQDIATLLKRPFDNLKNFFGADEETQIKSAWTDQILPKAKEAEKGFPFDNEGEADLTKLTAYLNPADGTLSKFYKERLQKFFEEANGQIKLKEGSAIKFSPEFVSYLNNAFRLRDALYGKSSTPTFGYDFRLQKVTDATIEVTIDGQKVDSNGTGSTTFKFPAQGGETGAFMNFSSTAEPTSTTTKPAATPTPSANSTPGTVNPSSTPGSKPLPSSNTPSGSSSLKFPGTWGLFKFFEAGGGSAKKQPSGEYLLTYKLGGKDVSATVKPTGGDLFDRNYFTSAKAPQNIK